MSLSIGVVTFDCHEPQRVAQFWSEALERPVEEGASEFFVSLGARPGAEPQPGLFFIRVPEPKQVKNRVHLDLVAPDPQAEADRLVGLGATRVADFNEFGFTWTTLRDPEGNEFDVGGGHA